MKIQRTQAFATLLTTVVAFLACLPTGLSTLLSEGLLTAAVFPAVAWVGLIVVVSVLSNYLFGDLLGGGAGRKCGFGISVPLILSPVFTIFWILLLADAESVPTAPSLLIYLAPVVGIVLLILSVRVRRRTPITSDCERSRAHQHATNTSRVKKGLVE